MAQTPIIDSLKVELNKAVDESERVDLYLNLFKELRYNDKVSAKEMADSAFQISEREGLARELGKSYRALGNIHFDKREYTNAILKFEDAEKIFENLGDDRLMSTILNDLGLCHMYIGDLECASYFFNEALFIAQESKDTLSIGTAYSSLSQVLFREEKIEEAIDTLKQILILDSLTGQWQYYIMDLANIGLSYKTILKYDEALDYSLRAYKKSVESGDYRIAYLSSSTIGETYMFLENEDAAKKYLTVSLEYAKKSGEEVSISDAYARLQLLSRKTGEIKKAIAYSDSALKYAAIYQKAVLFNNNGIMYQNDLELYDSAFNLYKKAIDISDQIGLKPMKIEPLLNIGFLLKKEGQIAKALMFVEQGLTLADSLNIPLRDKEALLNIADVYYFSKKYKTGYGFLLKAIVIQDSLLKVDRASQKKLQSFRDEINRLKINEQELIIEASKRKILERTYSIAFLVILTMILSGAYFIIRRKNTQLEIMREETHHRISNNIQVMISQISLRKDQLEDGKTRKALNSIWINLVAMGEIHDLLYQTDDHKESVKVGDYLSGLIKKLVDFHETENLNVETDIVIGAIQKKLKYRKAMQIGMVVNEIVTNSFKHAFEGIPNPKLRFTANMDDKKNLLIEIGDNGKGFPENFDFSKLDSFGVKMIDNFSERLNWNLSYESSKHGTLFNLSIPLN